MTLDSKEIQLAVYTLINNLPIIETTLANIQQATNQVAQLQRLRQLIKCGWPSNITNVSEKLREY